MLTQKFRKLVVGGDPDLYPLQVGLFLQTRTAILLVLLFFCVFCVVVLWVALRRVEKKAHVLLVYFAGATSILIALCIKKASMSRTSLEGGASISPPSTAKPSLREEFNTAVSSDYVGRSISSFLHKQHLLPASHEIEESKKDVQNTTDTEPRAPVSLQPASESANTDIHRSLLEDIEKKIEYKEKVYERFEALKRGMGTERSHVVAELRALKSSYLLFSKSMKHMKEKFLSSGVSLDLYMREVEELEKEVLKRFMFPGDEVVKSDMTAPGKADDEPTEASNTTFADSPPSYSQKTAGSALESGGSQYNSLSSIRFKLSTIEFYLVLQGIVSIVLIMVVLLGFDEYVSVFRLVLILMLLADIFVGIYILRDGLTLDAECMRRSMGGCRQNMQIIERVVGMLNADKETGGDPQSVVEKVFESISSRASEDAQKIQEYLGNYISSEADIKVLVVANLVDRLKAIEANSKEFVPRTQDREMFWAGVQSMSKRLRNIKHLLGSRKTLEMLRIYKKLSQVEYSFKNAAENVTNIVGSLAGIEPRDTDAPVDLGCKASITAICYSRDQHDDLSSTLVLLPGLCALSLLL